MEYTKGPWHVGIKTAHRGRDIYGPLGESVAITDDVCTAQDEALANARLIAAAPEMLEALRSASAILEQLIINRIEFLNPMDFYDACESICQRAPYSLSRARATIAKAEGK